MRPHRPGEYTCTCRAYKFPHRFGGGRCTGVFLTDNWPQKQCYNCPCHQDGAGCEVAKGAESIKECRIYQEFIEYWEIKV